MNLQQSNKTKQRLTTSQRNLRLIGAGLIVALIAGIALVPQLFRSNDSSAANNGNLRYTIAAGAWNSSSNWHGGLQPAAGDSVVVLHNMTGISNVSVGSNNQGALVIGSGVTFSPNNFSFGNNARFYNNGTVNWSSSPQWNGSPVWILNSGTMTFPNSLQPNGAVNIYNYAGATLRCSSTVTLPANSLIHNEGTFEMRNSLTARQNTNIRNLAGTMTVGTSGGTIILEGVTNFDNAKGATLHLLRSVTTQNQMTTFNNSGTMNIGSETADVNSTFNLVTINNSTTGVFNHYGNLKINSGNSNPVNTITNNNNFNVYGGLETHGPSVLNTTDTFYVEKVANVGSQLNVTGSSARMLVDGDLILNDKTGAALNMVNGGGIYVVGNLTVPAGKAITGTGTGNKLTVGGISTNNGTLAGNFDLCDLTGNGDPGLVDGGSGTAQSGVTNCVGTPLPVHFLSFSATTNSAGGADLQWTTASELNNSHFIIERSTDGKSFRKAGKVMGNGTKMTVSTYQFTDNTPIDGIVYYRLHQFDFNGDNEYSKTITIRKGDAAAKDEIRTTVFPNPVSIGGRGNVSVKYDLATGGLVVAELLSSSGQVISQRSERLPAGQTIQDFPLAGLKSGFAILRVTFDGQVTTNRIVLNP